MNIHSRKVIESIKEAKTINIILNKHIKGEFEFSPMLDDKLFHHDIALAVQSAFMRWERLNENRNRKAYD